MRVIHQSNELQPGSKRVCAAIGVFDGLHLGHRQVIAQTLRDAQALEAISVAVTFDRHPNEVVAPDRAPALLQSTAQRLRMFEKLGIDVSLVIPFDTVFSQKPAYEFIRELAADFQALRSLSVGSSFSFGYKRGGNVELLTELGRKLNFRVHGLASVSLDGSIVSSTRIRQAIQNGDFDQANQMLGRAWALEGKVISGDQRGRAIGFPTANLDVAGRVIPPSGVYAIHAMVGTSVHRGVINIGTRPTVHPGASSISLEAHLLDFQGDLYDQNLEITFVQRLREERRFASLDALKLQIATDIESARILFSKS